MKTKILVTGANGQLGQTIKELYAFDPYFEIVFATKEKLDITRKDALETFFENRKFNYCINCAAYTNVEQAELNSDLAFKVNAEGVKNLALQCKKHEVILFHVSTDYVFDGKKKTPYVEDDIPNPINQYGKSKLAGENYVQNVLANYFIIRTSWLYSKYGDNFLKTIVKKIENNEQMQITTSQKGTPTSCSDLVEFIFCLIKNKNAEYGIYHFSALGETTWYDYASQICKHFKGYNCKKIEAIKTFKSQTKRPPYSILDNTKSLRMMIRNASWKNNVDNTVKALVEGI